MKVNIYFEKDGSINSITIEGTPDEVVALLNAVSVLQGKQAKETTEKKTPRPATSFEEAFSRFVQGMKQE